MGLRSAYSAINFSGDFKNPLRNRSIPHKTIRKVKSNKLCNTPPYTPICIPKEGCYISCTPLHNCNSITIFIYSLPSLARAMYFFKVFLLILCFFIKSICFMLRSFKNNCISVFNTSYILSSFPTGLPLFLSLALIPSLMR